MLSRKVDCTCQRGWAEDFLCTVVESKGQKGLSDREGLPYHYELEVHSYIFQQDIRVFFIMHTLCACIPAALTRQTITTLKGAVTIPPVNQV